MGKLDTLATDLARRFQVSQATACAALCLVLKAHHGDAAAGRQVAAMVGKSPKAAALLAEALRTLQRDPAFWVSHYAMKSKTTAGLFTTGAGAATLAPGKSLSSGASLVAPGKRARLVMQSDGNLVLYDGPTTSKALWSSGTNGKPGASAIMQTDGNFVVYDGAHNALWSSGTSGHPGASLSLQDDGNLVVYDPSRKVLWTTSTDGFTKHASQGGGFNVFDPSSYHTIVEDPGKVLQDAAQNLSHPDRLIANTSKALAPIASLAKSIASNAIGAISLIPGIGTGVAAALSAGLAVLEGGSPLDIAIKTAYGAIPIPPGVKQFTDIVLDAVLSLLDAGGNVGNAAIALLKNETLGKLPDFAQGPASSVFDTLAHLFVQATSGNPTIAVTSKAMNPQAIAATAIAAATGQALPPHVTPVAPKAAAHLALALAPTVAAKAQRRLPFRLGPSSASLAANNPYDMYAPQNASA
jgi:hypothetical protein